MHTQTEMTLPPVGRAFLSLETEATRAPGWMETVHQPYGPALNFNVPAMYIFQIHQVKEFDHENLRDDKRIGELPNGLTAEE